MAVHQQLLGHGQRCGLPQVPRALIVASSYFAGTVAAVLLVAACGPPPSETTAAETQGATPAPSRTHLQIQGTGFRTADGRPFQWRGITAFRLLDYIADGNEAAARSYLMWAKSQQLTIVRVLAMGGGWMELKPEDGRRALPRLLSLAREQGLHVEVVALAGTRDMPVNLDEHLTALGTTLGEYPNALLEDRQRAGAPDARRRRWGSRKSCWRSRPACRRTCRSRSDRSKPTRRSRKADYATWHSPRDNKLDGWGHVLRRWPRGPSCCGNGRSRSISRRADRRRAEAPARAGATIAGAVPRRGALDAPGRAGRDLPLRGWPAGQDAGRPRAGMLQRLERSLDPAARRHRVRRERSLSPVLRAPWCRTSTARGRSAVFERVAGNRGWVLAVGPGEPALRLAAGWQHRRDEDVRRRAADYRRALVATSYLRS